MPSPDATYYQMTNSVLGELLTGMLPHDMLSLLSYIIQCDQPRHATSHSEIFPTKSVLNQENSP